MDTINGTIPAGWAHVLTPVAHPTNGLRGLTLMRHETTGRYACLDGASIMAVPQQWARETAKANAHGHTHTHHGVEHTH
jgi:hypothetical protein